jgi:hypothetical protein
LDKDTFVSNADEYGMTPEQAAEWWDSINGEIEETVGGGNFLESTALTGQYGHSGRLQAVKPQDADMMDRIKFLAGLTK